MSDVSAGLGKKEVVRDTKEQVMWALQKLEAALLDYDLEKAKDYTSIAKMWLSRAE